MAGRSGVEAKRESTSDVAHEAARRFKSMITGAWGERIRDVRIFGSTAGGDAQEGSELDPLYLICRLIMSLEHFEGLRRAERLLARVVHAQGVTVGPIDERALHAAPVHLFTSRHTLRGPIFLEWK